MKKFRYYWEDFPVGTVREFGGLTLTKEEMVRFAKQYDPQPFHVDEEAAKRTVFGGLIASGWQTCAAALRMMCDAYLLDAASAGSPGVQNKPHSGLIRNKWEVCNQKDEQVMHMEGYGMFLRRDHPA